MKKIVFLLPFFLLLVSSCKMDIDDSEVYSQKVNGIYAVAWIDSQSHCGLTRVIVIQKNKPGKGMMHAVWTTEPEQFKVGEFVEPVRITYEYIAGVEQYLWVIEADK